MRTHLFLLLASLSLACAVADEESRTWTNAKGQTVEGTLVQKTATSVSLKLGNGKTVSISLNQLSEDDRAYLAGRAQDAGATPDKPKEAKKEADAPLPTGPNFDSPWPKNVRIPIEQDITIIKEEPGEYIYESPHFRFESEAQLNLKLMRTLSCVFESTFEANCALPLNSLSWEIKRDPHKKYLAKLYETSSSYRNATGVGEFAAGVFINGVVHVPFDSLGLKKLGQKYTIGREGNPKTLIHEITHQMTLPGPTTPISRADWYPIWFSEGIAEYVAHTPYQSGNFGFGLTKKFLVEYVTAYNKKTYQGRAIGDKFTVPNLQKFMNMSHQSFMSGNVQLNYGFSALLAFYFFQIDGQGDAARIKKYLQAFQDGKGLDEANKALLDGRTWEELEKDVSEGMRKNLKVSPSFSSSSQFSSST